MWKWVLLFVLLTPGILFTIPPFGKKFVGGGKIATALLHSVLFAVLARFFMLCTEGFQEAQEAQEYHAPCSPGQYSPDGTPASCVTCPAGKYSENGDECVYCPNGKTPNELRTACVVDTAAPAVTPNQCGAGQYFISAGLFTSARCAACPSGNKCAGGNVAPVKCQSGTYSNGGASVCSSCPNGKYNIQPGSTSCMSCASPRTVNAARTTCT